jgi:NitT/TauT family transport system substrate-binding protein
MGDIMKSKVLVGAIIAAVVIAAVWFLVARPVQTTTNYDKVAFTFDWVIGGFYAPYILADEEGFYRDQNLAVSFEQGQGADTAAKLVDQGKYDVATGNAAATAIAIASGLHIRSVGTIDQDAVTDIFALKSTGIQKPADLVGKKLGVRYYDVSHSEYIAMMKAQGLDPSKVNEISIGFDPQPLLSGQIDAMYNYAYNIPVQLKLRGIDLSEILVKDYGVSGYGANIIAGDKFIASRPDVLRRFLLASAHGWDLARKNPEMAIAVLVKRYPEIDKSVALATFKAELQWLRPESSDVTAQFCQDKKRWNSTVATYVSVGLIKTPLNAADVFTNQFLAGCP